MRGNFCAAPWSGLSLDPDGSAKICCISQDRVSLAEFAQVSTISKFTEIRNAVISDQQHPNCNNCWQREKASSHWESRRSIYQYDDFFYNLNSPDSFQLEHLDLRWSNTCNLNCVYCGPVFSSRWAKLEGLSQSFRIFPKVLDSDLKNLKVLQLAGGEPLLIKQNAQILERLQKINPAIKIEITSNLTQTKNNRIYELLKEFNNVTWIVSFEAIERRFEYIRNGAKWETFYSNLRTLHLDFLDIQINMVYFPLSSLEIGAAIDIALEFTKDYNVFLVSQIGGHGFDDLGQAALQYINDRSQSLSLGLPEILKTRLQDQLTKATTQLEKTDLPLYNKFDQLTNQNHKEIFKELYYE
jgi:molybdenum cofactor biosynthesis enzyme MoaA